METVAVYEEHPIRVYGLKLRHRLMLFSAMWPLDGAGACGAFLGAVQGSAAPVFSNHRLGGGGWEITLCLPDEMEAELVALWEKSGPGSLRSARPVSLVHLQGPHFGDRYGVLSEALAALEEAGAPPLATSAVVHSVFLALEPARAEAALSALGKRFCAAG